MRILNKLLFILPLICVITSCGDTELEAPEIIPSEPSVISFWEEQSHLVMMGWKGKVNAVKEFSYIVPFERQSKDEEAVSSSEWKFDISGHLIYYNPTSIEPTIYARDVWQVMACYSYGYDKAGKMVKVIVNDFSGDPVIYTLTYGEHEVFVPLIFPLGIYDFFLVKGLESISDADGSVLYTYSGNKAIYTTESWSGVTSTTFEYDEGVMYPVRKIVTLKRGGVIANMEITSYLYNEDGSLASSDKIVKEGENEVERTVVRYMASTLLPVSKLTDAGGQLDWTYKYEEAIKEPTCRFCKAKILEVPDDLGLTPYFSEKGDQNKVDQIEKKFLEEYIMKQPEFDEAAYRKSYRLDPEPEKSSLSTAPRLGPQCPSCGSTNTSKIGVLGRSTSIFAFGLASNKIGKNWKCKNCGHTW